MHARMTMWTVVLFVAAMLLNPWGAQADDASGSNDEEARVHFRLGTAYYESGRFAQAAQEFEQAYQLSKRPQLQYNLFLAYRDAGEIAKAASALRQYLNETPDIEGRSQLEARLLALEKILETQPEPQAAQPATDASSGPDAVADNATPASTSPVDDAPQRESNFTRYLPWSLIGGGSALILAGVVTGTLGLKDQQKLEDDCPNPDKCSLTAEEVESLKSSGSLKVGMADALWITGAVSAGVGITFLFWKPWEQASTPSPVDVACGPRSCGATYTQRF